MAYCSNVDTCCLLIGSIYIRVNLTKFRYQLGTPCVVDIVSNPYSKIHIPVRLISYDSELINIKVYTVCKI